MSLIEAQEIDGATTELDQTKLKTMRAGIEKVTLFSEAVIEFGQNILTQV